MNDLIIRGRKVTLIFYSSKHVIVHYERVTEKRKALGTTFPMSSEGTL